MHTLTKIKLFRTLLWITYPLALIFVYPLAATRRKSPGHLFFFFDRYIMGGAQTVHLAILNVIPDLHKQIYFTRTSSNDRHRSDFYNLENTEVFEVQQWCENLLMRLFSVHYFAFYINRHEKAHIFSSNCTFFYDMLPFLARHVVTTELLHSFSGQKNGMEFFGVGNYKYLANRIVIDSKSYNNIKKQYANYNVPTEYFNRIKFIQNAVQVPAVIDKNYGLPLNVLYAGRGGEEKRIDRIDRLAKACIEQHLPIKFHFAGDESLTEKLSDFVKANSTLYGNITNPEKMYEIYGDCHVVLITSVFEGFPMVVMEGMACGCVPMVTALEGMMYHLKHGENALLMFELKDEDALLQEGIANLKNLVADHQLLQRLSKSCHTYALQHFGREQFIKAYRVLLR